MEQRIPVAVLAATGAVGQRFVSLLADHPWFEVRVVTASQRSSGQRYGDAVNWVVPGEIPPEVADMTVQNTTPETVGDVALVFSALPSSAARTVEPQLAEAGCAVCSNASAYRMAPDVPLLIPDINADHVQLIEAQRRQRGWSGLLVASPNCSTTGIVFPLAALHRAFGVTQVHAVTMQAISGAGHPGVPSLDIMDNVVPYIGGEEEKVEHEPQKLLGAFTGEGIEPAEITVSAQTHRVPVVDGHLAALSIEMRENPSPELVQKTLAEFSAPEDVHGLPGLPARSIVVRKELDRPQPRRDRDAEGGMAVTVGRVQPCPVFTTKLISLVHNTVRGAAGGAILNAEWLVKSGYIEM